MYVLRMYVCMYHIGAHRLSRTIESLDAKCGGEQGRSTRYQRPCGQLTKLWLWPLLSSSTQLLVSKCILEDS